MNILKEKTIIKYFKTQNDMIKYKQ